MKQFVAMPLILSLTVSVSLAAGRQDQPAALKTLTNEVTARIVERTNEFRKENDLKPVAVDAKLKKTAQQFAEFMAKTSKYGHRADGRAPAERAKAAGYDYCIVRENIAYRSGPRPNVVELTDVFVEGWIDSPGHRENMLAEFVLETGVAVAADGEGKIYAVQLFGRPKSASIRIRITNQTEQAQTLVVSADDSSEDFEIPPRVIMNMTRCRPVRLSIADNRGLRVTESQALDIVSGDDGDAMLKRTSSNFADK